VREHRVYSSEVLELGTVEGLRGWTKEALHTLRAHEMNRPCWVPPLTAVWLAGSIPTAAFHALLLPLLAGSAVYAKPSSHDPISARLFAECLCTLDPAVGAAIKVGRNHTVLEQADAVVAHGSDETIAAIRNRLPVGRVCVGNLAAEAVGLDIALYDGRGCLSPAYVLVCDQPRGRAEAFAVALGDVLERLSSVLPRGPLATTEEATLHQLRARAAVREGVRLEMSSHSSNWTVILEPRGGSQPPPGLLRAVPVIPLAEPRELPQRCAALAPHLSSIGQAGWGSQRPLLTLALREGGGSRTCPLGRMQYPPLDWNHDGKSPLRSILRFTTDEDDEEQNR
jgi:hypothetical protein